LAWADVYRHGGFATANTFVNPAAHGGVQGQREGFEYDAALRGFGHRLGGMAPVGGFGHAHGARCQTNLVIDEVGEGHGEDSKISRAW
jgi:hypothetical protein